MAARAKKAVKVSSKDVGRIRRAFADVALDKRLIQQGDVLIYERRGEEVAFKWKDGVYFFSAPNYWYYGEIFDLEETPTFPWKSEEVKEIKKEVNDEDKKRKSVRRKK